MIRLHDTRHTAATRMLDSGTTVSATAKWLGHDPAMTLRVYGHVYEDALASAGDVLLAGMSPANGERSFKPAPADGSARRAPKPRFPATRAGLTPPPRMTRASDG